MVLQEEDTLSLRVDSMSVFWPSRILNSDLVSGTTLVSVPMLVVAFLSSPSLVRTQSPSEVSYVLILLLYATLLIIQTSLQQGNVLIFS